MAPSLAALPEELKRSSRWVLWRLEDSEKRERCKVPKTVRGRNADPVDPDTWSTLEQAEAALPNLIPLPKYKDDPSAKGVGLVIGAPYLALDVDKCYDGKEVEPWARDLIAKIPKTYAELSPSRRGFHFWYRCSDWPKVPDGIRSPKVEVYARKRYFTVTGDHVVSTPALVTELTLGEAKALFSLVEGLKASRMGQKEPPNRPLEGSSKLKEMMEKADFGDVSAAVHSLLVQLGIQHTCDRRAMEAQFKASKLYQETHWKEKWERLGESELDKACELAAENIQKRLLRKKDTSDCVRRAVLVNLSQVEPRELTWLWPRRVPAGNVTIFAGDPGMAKSLMALDLVGRGSVGRDFLDGTPNTVGRFKSLLLMLEDDRETILVPRLMAIKADLKMVEALDMIQFVDEVDEVKDERLINLESDLDKIRDILQKDPLIKLCVIDPISNYMGDKSMHNDQEFRSILMPVIALAQETGVSFIVIVHNSKQTGRTALQKIAISLGGVGTARIAWTFLKTEENHQMLLIKKNLGNFPGIEYGTEEVAVRISGKDTGQAVMVYKGATEASAENVLADQEDPESKREKPALRLLQRMLEGGKETASKAIFEEAQRQGVSDISVKRAKKELGVITTKKKNGWYWRLNDQADPVPPKTETQLF